MGLTLLIIPHLHCDYSLPKYDNTAYLNYNPYIILIAFRFQQKSMP